MDRRQVVASIPGPALGIGVAQFIASLQPSLAREAAYLHVGGTAAVALAAGIWIALFASTPTTKKDRDYIRMDEAGQRLYQANAEVRAMLKHFVPDAYADAATGATSYALDGAKQAGVTVFARRAPSLPLERVEYDELDRTAFDRMFDPDRTELQDISIRKGDLSKILAHYRDK